MRIQIMASVRYFHSIIVFLTLMVGITATSAHAQQAREYSTEGYCILSFEQVDNEYLIQYEKRLGFRPKIKLCNRVNRLVSEFQPAKWNYKYGQPYPGSSIYLTPEQVAKIQEAKDSSRQVRR